MAESAWVVEVTEASFENAVMQQSQEVPVVIDFWASWCNPCRILGPLLETLAEEYTGKFILAKIDVDANPLLAQSFRVTSIPMVVAIVEGKIAGYFAGVVPEQQLREFLDQICPTEADRLIRAAASLEASDPATARARYERALELDPKKTAAAAALAELALLAGDDQQAAAYVGRVSEGDDGWPRAASVRSRLDFHRSSANQSIEDYQAAATARPNDLQARLDLGLAYAAHEQYEPALETLVQVLETDRTFAADPIKQAMVKIFGIVGPQTELANRYRARLASALY